MMIGEIRLSVSVLDQAETEIGGDQNYLKLIMMIGEIRHLSLSLIRLKMR